MEQSGVQQMACGNSSEAVHGECSTEGDGSPRCGGVQRFPRYPGRTFSGPAPACKKPEEPALCDVPVETPHFSCSVMGRFAKQLVFCLVVKFREHLFDYPVG